MYRYLYGQTGSRETAEDLTSITFVRALTALSRFRSAQPVRPWLLRIAHNALVDHRRAAARAARLIVRLASMRVAQADTQPLVDDAEQFRALTAGLPKAQRDALALRFLAGLELDEVATVLQRSRAATRMLLTRALRILRARAEGGGMVMSSAGHDVDSEIGLLIDGSAPQLISGPLGQVQERLTAARRQSTLDPAFAARLRATLLAEHRTAQRRSLGRRRVRGAGWLIAAATILLVAIASVVATQGLRAALQGTASMQGARSPTGIRPVVSPHTTAPTTSEQVVVAATSSLADARSSFPPTVRRIWCMTAGHLGEAVTFVWRHGHSEVWTSPPYVYQAAKWRRVEGYLDGPYAPGSYSCEIRANGRSAGTAAFTVR